MKVLIADKFPDQYVQRIRDLGAEATYEPTYGAEDTFVDPAEPGPAGLISQFRDLRNLPADEMTLQLTVRIDERRASSKHDDDITVIVMDVVGS